MPLDFNYKKIKNPVLKDKKNNLRDPACIIYNDTIYLFFTIHNLKDNSVCIGMTRTNNFIDFDYIKVISPMGYASPGNVIKVNNKWILCYQQYKEFPHYLCFSFSEDLEIWSEPVKFFNTDKTNKWNIDQRTIDPYIVKDENCWWCFYTGSNRWGKKTGYNMIGVAKSYDLLQWEDISKEKPIIGVDYEWELPDGNENNCVIRLKDKWFMLYSASLTYQKIAYAISYDLIYWEKRGLCDIPIFKESELRFGAPFIIEELSKENKYYMIYMAEDKNNKTSFILLESNDLIRWR
ncbi:MAG: hypothetical protein NC915_03325 [Candidatus Omnitrophica bacterium]|nr:hypothetical protein [Candidatus Omnitrophota bacterium]